MCDIAGEGKTKWRCCWNCKCSSQNPLRHQLGQILGLDSPSTQQRQKPRNGKRNDKKRAWTSHQYLSGQGSWRPQAGVHHHHRVPGQQDPGANPKLKTYVGNTGKLNKSASSCTLLPPLSLVRTSNKSTGPSRRGISMYLWRLFVKLLAKVLPHSNLEPRYLRSKLPWSPNSARNRCHTNSPAPLPGGLHALAHAARTRASCQGPLPLRKQLSRSSLPPAAQKACATRIQNGSKRKPTCYCYIMLLHTKDTCWAKHASAAATFLSSAFQLNTRPRFQTRARKTSKTTATLPAF